MCLLRMWRALWKRAGRDGEVEAPLQGEKVEMVFARHIAARAEVAGTGAQQKHHLWKDRDLKCYHLVVNRPRPAWVQEQKRQT